MSEANKDPPRLSRSFSLPNSESLSTKELDDISRLNCGVQTRRKSKSLSRVDDQSNSAAPVRRQPHPFALQALGFRPIFGGRGPRLPEWPPPDPPPLTPLNIGLGRNLLSPPQGANAPQIWPPRPWWRRSGQSRPTNQVVHVAFDTADATVPPPGRLIERPARIGWTSTSDEAEVDHDTAAVTDTASPVPQHASLSEVDGNAIHGEFSTSVVATDIRPVVTTQMPVTLAAAEGTRIHTTQSAGPTEEVGLISLSSEEVQEESTFQIFIVVDTNPGTHNDSNYFREAGQAVTPGFMERIMQHIANNLFMNGGESGLELQSLNDSGSSYDH